MVPFVHSEKFVKGLEVGEAKGGVKKVVVVPGVGHECTPDMAKQMADFVFEYGLRE